MDEKELKDNRGCKAILNRITSFWIEDFTYDNQPSTDLKPFYKTLLVTTLTLTASSWIFWTGMNFCPLESNYLCILHRLDLTVRAIIKLLIFMNILALYYTCVVNTLCTKYFCGSKCCKKTDE
jgi:hypothetical protein